MTTTQLAHAARHSAATPRWGTPADIVERARTVMGAIDLDPCTEIRFEGVVRAEVSYSLLDRGDNGLELPWRGRVLCNPPGGLVRAFWRRAMTQPLDQLVWIGFSVEQLGVLADEAAHPLDFCTCILRKRIGFTRHDGYVGSPSHANYITGAWVDRERFADAFGPLGKLVYGPRSNQV